MNLLTNNLLVYVDASAGHDLPGNGSKTAPFATLQYARTFAQQGYDLGFKWSVAYYCNGTFSAGVIAESPLYGQQNPASETWVFSDGSVVVGSANSANCGFQVDYDAMFCVLAQGALTIESPNPGGAGAEASQGTINFLNQVTFSNCAQACVQTNQGGQIFVNDFYTTGSCNAFAFASGGTIQFNPGKTGYIVGNPTYFEALLWAHGSGSVIGAAGFTFSGVYQGKKTLADGYGYVEA